MLSGLFSGLSGVTGWQKHFVIIAARQQRTRTKKKRTRWNLRLVADTLTQQSRAGGKSIIKSINIAAEIRIEITVCILWSHSTKKPQWPQFLQVFMQIVAVQAHIGIWMRMLMCSASVPALSDCRLSTKGGFQWQPRRAVLINFEQINERFKSADNTSEIIISN